MSKPGGPPGFRAILRVVEFRALLLAEAQSLLGDQIARVALAVLSYERTHSPLVTGAVYALTFVPALVGGALLSRLADHFPRRDLMVACDLIRAALIATMAIPTVPLPVLCVLLFVAILVGRPFAAAQAALLPHLLPDNGFTAGVGLRMVTDQSMQLLGFGVGGLVVAAIGPRSGLALDAATYLVSAGLVWRYIRIRVAAPTVDADAGDRPRSQLRMILASAPLRTLLGLGLLAGLHVVPEGVAPSYAHAVGGGTVAVGVLMAALPLGTAIGVVAMVRCPEFWRAKLIGPWAVLTAVPLALCALRPGLCVSVLLWVVSGFFAAYQAHASAEFVTRIPDEHRGRVVGLASSALLAAQGIGVVGFGYVAGHLGAARAVGAAGALALLLAVPIATAWAKERPGVHRRESMPIPGAR